MKRLSIIIPVYNEQGTVGEVLRRISAAPTPGYEKEIIVVDDGSTDGTGPLLDALKDRFGFDLSRHPSNRGKGAAIKTALGRASGDLILIQDADLEYDQADYAKLLAAFGPASPVVYGSRYLGNNPIGYTLLNVGNHILTWCTNALFRSRLTDINTCYKLFRADILKGLGPVSDGFDIEIEMTAKTLRAGHPIVETAISYRPRKYDAGKKIRLIDGLKDILAILKFRFGR